MKKVIIVIISSVSKKKLFIEFYIMQTCIYYKITTRNMHKKERKPVEFQSNCIIIRTLIIK